MVAWPRRRDDRISLPQCFSFLCSLALWLFGRNEYISFRFFPLAFVRVAAKHYQLACAPFAGRQTRKMTTERPLSVRFMCSACCTLTLLFLLQKKAQRKNTHTFSVHRNISIDRFGESVDAEVSRMRCTECSLPEFICVCNVALFAKNSNGKIVVLSSVIIDVPLPLNRARSAHPEHVLRAPLRAAPSQSHFGYVSHSIHSRLPITMSEMICISLMRSCVQFPRSV